MMKSKKPVRIRFSEVEISDITSAFQHQMTLSLRLAVAPLSSSLFSLILGLVNLELFGYVGQIENKGMMRKEEMKRRDLMRKRLMKLLSVIIVVNQATMQEIVESRWCAIPTIIRIKCYLLRRKSRVKC